MQVNFRNAGSAVLLILFTCLVAMGQEFRGSITGRVTDPNGSVVAGATVTLTNSGTNEQSTIVTNEDGAYSAPVTLSALYVISKGCSVRTFSKR
jgi:hypothetical protein